MATAVPRIRDEALYERAQRIAVELLSLAAEGGLEPVDVIYDLLDRDIIEVGPNLPRPPEQTETLW